MGVKEKVQQSNKLSCALNVSRTYPMDECATWHLSSVSVDQQAASSRGKLRRRGLSREPRNCLVCLLPTNIYPLDHMETPRRATINGAWMGWNFFPHNN